MARYKCSVCGYEYDESKEDTSWEALLHDWTCPICGAARSEFELVGGELHQEAGQSAAVNPVSPFGGAALAHRVFGYVFLAIYVILMIQMVPRLWTYQIEFPARTVVHITLGMAIGASLILKITIVRFFRRLDQTLVPSLGTAVLVASVVLIGISVPAAFREAFATRSLFADENRERVRTLLSEISSQELDEAECTRLASKGSLRGRPTSSSTGVYRLSRSSNGVGQAANARELATDGTADGRSDDRPSIRSKKTSSGRSLPT